MSLETDAFNSQQHYQQQYDQQQVNNSSSNGQRVNNAGVWNWISQNKLVNTFVEKAKIGVESFVTTVDPQMSNYNRKSKLIAELDWVFSSNKTAL